MSRVHFTDCLLQDIPGPGRYEFKSQFEVKLHTDDPDPDQKAAPFGSNLQVYTMTTIIHGCGIFNSGYFTLKFGDLFSN